MTKNHSIYNSVTSSKEREKEILEQITIIMHDIQHKYLTHMTINWDGF